MKLELELLKQYSYDVIVAGSGPAGLCAAMSAARLGCRVAVLERFGVVGGNLTVGHIRTVMGGVSSGTMAEEMAEVLQSDAPTLAHQVEHAKAALTQWLAGEKNIDVFLQTTVFAAQKDGDRVTGLYACLPEGNCLFTAPITIDATGDGHVCHMAGVTCRVGRDKDGLTQPASVLYTLTGVADGAVCCVHEQDDTILPDGTSFLALCQQAADSGEIPACAATVRLYPTARKGERMVNATQVNRVNGLLAADVTAAQIELRRQIAQITAFLQKKVPGYENCILQDSSDIAGFRETRRILGLHTLHEAEMAEGCTFPDVIVHKASFPFDIHNPDGSGQAEDFAEAHRIKPYDIPYRCLVPQQVDGLLAAGRCISGTHKAHSSYRVMNICMAIGQAAGIAAALAVQHEQQPREVAYEEIQQHLQRCGVELFD